MERKPRIDGTYGRFDEPRGVQVLEQLTSMSPSINIGSEAEPSSTYEDGHNHGRPMFDSADAANEPHLRPLRVLHVINSFGVGGTERGLLKLMEGMDGRFFEQRICTIRGFAGELEESPAVRERLLSVGLKSEGFQFLPFRLMQVMKTYKPHIVHSRNWGAIEAVPAGRMAGVPVVIHSEHGYEMDMLSGLPLRRRLLRRVFYPLCDAVFTVSLDLRNYHSRQSWVSPDRLRVISNGVDTKLFAPNSTVRSQTRSRLGFSPESIVLGSVGRMVPIKGHHTLLRTAERLIELGFDIRVLLVGGGPELERHRRYAESSSFLNGRLTLVGSALHVSELYQAMDIFVLPSICEGMSNTLLEAMASGLPCVATNVGGNPELLADSRWGFLFTPEDVSELTERLEGLVRQPDLRARCAVAGREAVLSRFSLGRMLDDYANLYFDLAAKRGIFGKN
jgi:sugar transferase (PEP-CTERM/EpsH1 system associated)